MSKRRGLSLGLLFLLTLLTLSWSNLQAQDRSSVVGSWNISITGTPFGILRTYGEGGVVVDAYSFPPLVGSENGDGANPSQCVPTSEPLTNSGGHGEWVEIEPRLYAVTVKYFQLDPTLNASAQILNSIGTVREIVEVSEDYNTYTSRFDTDITLLDGTLGCVNSGATAAERIKIEPLN